MEQYGYKISYFCDNDKNKIGKIIDGIPVISSNELYPDFKEYLVILTSKPCFPEMYKQLTELNFPRENIVRPRLGLIAAINPAQYFDVFEPDENEIFVDVGAYNGDTVKDFMEWTNGNYKKIYSLEPMESLFESIEKRCRTEKWENTILSNTAAWNRSEKLCFLDDDSASRAVEGKTAIEVQGETIDHIVGDEKVTFIKMDVEGSELEALEGAKNTIQRNRPKLAISIYHKCEDIIDLPLKILELVPEYHFYLRHYSTNMWKTVLYACVK